MVVGGLAEAAAVANAVIMDWNMSCVMTMFPGVAEGAEADSDEGAVVGEVKGCRLC